MLPEMPFNYQCRTNIAGFERLKGTKNGFKITNDSDNEGFKFILNLYGEKGVKCIIANSKTTSKYFYRKLFTGNFIVKK